MGLTNPSFLYGAEHHSAGRGAGDRVHGAAVGRPVQLSPSDPLRLDRLCAGLGLLLPLDGNVTTLDLVVLRLARRRRRSGRLPSSASGSAICPAAPDCRGGMTFAAMTVLPECGRRGYCSLDPKILALGLVVAMVSSAPAPYAGLRWRCAIYSQAHLLAWRSAATWPSASGGLRSAASIQHSAVLAIGAIIAARWALSDLAVRRTAAAGLRPRLISAAPYWCWRWRDASEPGLILGRQPRWRRPGIRRAGLQRRGGPAFV